MACSRKCTNTAQQTPSPHTTLRSLPLLATYIYVYMFPFCFLFVWAFGGRCFLAALRRDYLSESVLNRLSFPVFICRWYSRERNRQDLDFPSPTSSSLIITPIGPIFKRPYCGTALCKDRHTGTCAKTAVAIGSSLEVLYLHIAGAS